MKRLLGLLSIAFVVFLATAPQSMAKSKKEPIKFGYLNSFTGPGASTTAMDYPGVKLAVEEINAAGGVLGRPLEVVARDSKLNPEQALREAKDLVMNQKVFWIEGITSSGVCRAVSQYMKQQKKILVATVAKSERLTGEWGNRYFFRSTNNVHQEVIGLARAAKDILGAPKKLYLLNPDYEGGHSAAENFVRVYKSLVPGVKIVGQAWPKLGTQDFTANITAVMNSGADLMFTSFYQTDALAMIKQMIAMGANGKFAMVGMWHGTFATVQKFNKDFYPKRTIGGGQYAFWAIHTPESEMFVKTIKDKYNVYPEYAPSTYAFTKAMAAAINKVGSLDTEKVIDALEGYVMNTPVGPVEIRACDHQAMWPDYVGLIGPVPGYSFYGTQDPKVYGAEAYRSCDEIAKVRGK